MLKQMSDHGRNLLMQWEGFRTKVYDDGAGYLTIGVGHALTATEKVSGKLDIDGAPVSFADGISEEQVQSLLSSDLKVYELALNEAITTDLTQNQFDALVSFCFNVGVGAFRSSTVLKDVNGGNLADVPGALRMWDKAGGVVNKGLANRREKEVGLWLEA